MNKQERKQRLKEIFDDLQAEDRRFLRYELDSLEKSDIIRNKWSEYIEAMEASLGVLKTMKNPKPGALEVVEVVEMFTLGMRTFEAGIESQGGRGE